MLTEFQRRTKNAIFRVIRDSAKADSYLRREKQLIDPPRVAAIALQRAKELERVSRQLREYVRDLGFDDQA